MTPISIKINDSTTWDPMIAAAEIVQALRHQPRIEINFVMEAPDIASTELPALFDWLSSQGIDLGRITIHTGNLMEEYDRVQVQHHPHFMFELPVIQALQSSLPTHKHIRYHFGHLVGRCTMPRLIIASHLFSLHADKSFQTFHWRPDNGYHKNHLGLEQLLDRYGASHDKFHRAVHLLQHAPLAKDIVRQYPILHPENLSAPCTWYPQFFLDIVCESWHQGNNFFLTEKFWRAVATRTPFIIHGPQWMLHRLRALRFRTFDQWWDEGYDQDPGDHNVEEILAVIDTVSTWSLDKTRKIYEDMASVLDHNLQVFRELSHTDLYKVRDLSIPTRMV